MTSKKQTPHKSRHVSPEIAEELSILRALSARNVDVANRETLRSR